MLLLTEQCTLTQEQKTMGKYWDNHWHGSRFPSYQSMTFGKQTITLNAELPNLHEVIKEVSKAQADKVRKELLRLVTMPKLVENVRIGSHNEYHHHKYWQDGEYVEDKQHSYNVCVEDFRTVYHDNLAGKEWLESNHDKTYDSPTIEITVNDDSFHANGDFKPGMIKDFMSKYTKRVRAGRKAVTIDITPDRL